MIVSIILMLAVIAVIVGAVWRYQRVRQNTGYHTGKCFTVHQQMGAFIGNDHIERMGMEKEYADQKVDNDEEIFVLPDANQLK